MKPAKVKHVINLGEQDQQESKKAFKKKLRFNIRVLRCPRCKREMALDHMQRYENYGISLAAQRRKKNRRIFWTVVAVLIVLAVLAAFAALKLYRAGLIPQNVLNFVKSVLPYRVERLLQSIASNGIWQTFKAVIAK